MRVIKIARFLAETDNVEWLIDGLLPNVGWTFFYGLAGLGKTTFAMQMCDSLQRGVPFLGRRTKQCNILYVQADSIAMEWKSILQRIAPKSDGWTAVEVPDGCFDSPLYVNNLLTLVEKVQPGFIVYDSLYNLTKVPLNTEKILLPVSQMKAVAAGIPWLLIHHPTKEGSVYSGHNSLGGNCSNQWSLLKTKLKIEKGRLVSDKEILLDRDENGLWCLKEDRIQSTTYADLLSREI